MVQRQAQKTTPQDAQEREGINIREIRAASTFVKYVLCLHLAVLCRHIGVLRVRRMCACLAAIACYLHCASPCICLASAVPKGIHVR